ncbi:MAG: 50S ribosomal protein L9 [Candidatus Tectomicrobia bacterium]|uniref:Large ribosomal subunit protein bL9 n=1 Tax=Tectimicrobiota bacterium TaxID=2528274 RepID=A0A937VZZ1_UNCTE|nr:50S ribosomal protein L9 [Candidatus Tectomicrobia bacterium]
MKVILMRDVDHVGDVGDVVDVADGYGRNFLIPQGLAVAATAKNKRQLEHEQRLREHRILRARKDAQVLAEQLQTVACRFVRKAGEEGKLFGSVTSMDIAEALRDAGYSVDRRSIQLDQPIKNTGEFTVPVRLPAETSAVLTVTVTAE